YGQDLPEVITIVEAGEKTPPGTPAKTVERAKGDVFLIRPPSRGTPKPGMGPAHQPTKVELPEPPCGRLTTLLQRRDPSGHRVSRVHQCASPRPQHTVAAGCATAAPKIKTYLSQILWGQIKAALPSRGNGPSPPILPGDRASDRLK